ncbi:MAG: RagB/SusD family nutrient uptake outer membrane protein [Muribaculaceae bacterium]|nr:RagB/SusD family nutrient uptake outer membrane protein [Muribaculaceae bacterium]
MKAIYKPLVALALIAPVTLTSCLEETEPTNGVTESQLQESSKALDSSVAGIGSFMKKYHVWSTQASDFGYPSQIIIREVMGQDMIQTFNNYQHFNSFQVISVAINEDYLLNQIVWYYYNLQVNAANGVIQTIDPASANDTELNMLGQALAYRAYTYLDMANMYEYLPVEGQSSINSAGNNVLNLTVPITDPRNPVDPADNPRATHEKMLAFLLADLDEAEGYFTKNNSREDKTRPDLSVVYGLKARVYMWDGNYAKAAEYARKAISTGQYSPLTRDQWLSTTSGFNDMSVPSWMLAISQTREDDAVQSYSNWTSFMSSEDELGYGGYCKNPMIIDKSLYDQISDRDFRKLSWVAPEGSALSGEEVFINPQTGADIQEYASLKFRPGAGNLTDNNVAFATDIPLMRIEEMYFIEAEANAHMNPAAGKQLLETFMQTYRYNTYACSATTEEDVVEEILLQKRIEFWGEGITTFDFKRLNHSVIRNYDGTNWPETTRFNTNGRPGWLNFVMCGLEGRFNLGCKGFNNPDVGGTFKE